ncbi:hypothetical protein PRZ48_002852 [Zasmidium cellare]|uniref:Uncharacterized protein n=1 Tax=Zasmidium cellare TaxID=395010 RepID=A0ABR0ETD4_ZASCE|nr:hypothetical protein PRZ48_002852 [Zasmidium cellare]
MFCGIFMVQGDLETVRKKQADMRKSQASNSPKTPAIGIKARATAIKTKAIDLKTDLKNQAVALKTSAHDFKTDVKNKAFNMTTKTPDSKLSRRTSVLSSLSWSSNQHLLKHFTTNDEEASPLKPNKPRKRKSTTSQLNPTCTPPLTPPTPKHRRNFSTTIETMMSRIMLNRPQDGLTDFAITHFNAELLIFLRSAVQWRFQWAGQLLTWSGEGKEEARIKCFAHAAWIFYLLVDEKAEFPMNMSPRAREKLKGVFACARLKRERERAATPVFPWEHRVNGGGEKRERVSPQKALTEVPINAYEALNRIQVLPVDNTHRLMTAREESAVNVAAAMIDRHLDAPATFDLTVFDEAVIEIKTQAYHNIWMPYLSVAEKMQSESAWLKNK